MPIETICQTCARKLRVADEYAGKKARCPQCHTIYVVPGRPEAITPELEDTTYKEPQPGPVEPVRMPASHTDQWQLRTSDGRVYGPVPKRELDQWQAEGRIPPEAMILAEQKGSWMSAVDVYPQLRSSRPLTAASNPFADAPATSVFQGSGFQVRPAATFQQPHRGLMILIFGILGWVFCFIFAPIAWSMGHADLREMRRGTMDPSGIPMTQAGMILGMICTILGLLFLGLLCMGSMLG